MDCSIVSMTRSQLEPLFPGERGERLGGLGVAPGVRHLPREPSLCVDGEYVGAVGHAPPRRLRPAVRRAPEQRRQPVEVLHLQHLQLVLVHRVQAQRGFGDSPGSHESPFDSGEQSALPAPVEFAQGRRAGFGEQRLEDGLVPETRGEHERVPTFAVSRLVRRLGPARPRVRQREEAPARGLIAVDARGADARRARRVQQRRERVGILRRRVGGFVRALVGLPEGLC
mmetsp:Transcript_13539/g.56877  ORF Transcript_13539/g.56877 Transcript_13539/m.56877 type:complete len:227 (-) Transcript_13539:866-1546(-)